MTLRRKLLLWYTGVLAVSGSALMLALYLFTAHQMRREAEKFLRDQCEGWAHFIQEMGTDVPKLRAMIGPEVETRRYFPLMFRLYDAQAREDVLVIGPGIWRDAIPQDEEFADPGPKRRFMTVPVGRHGNSLRMLAERLEVEGGRQLVLQGGMYIRRLDARLQKLQIFLALAVATGIGLAFVGGRFLAERSLRPIDEIASELDGIEAANLSARLSVPASRDEVARLRTGINRMLQRLEGSFERIQRFTADAAHDLRTPLASLQCRLEVAVNKPRSEEEYRQVVSDALRETEGLARTVNDLLLLTRMDARAEHPPLAPLPLRELLAELREVFDLAAEQKGLQLAFTGDDDCVALGDRELLRKLFGNLIDNAIRYTPSGGSITVTVAREHGENVARVSDTGIGIAPELQEKIFERFVRADDSRSREDGGVGLGLSICRSIAVLHGGTITVQSTVGEGSTFEVRLPGA